MRLLIFDASEWMDGPMSGVDPDQVENDIGSIWRTLYKMEKSFSECPNPLKMAQKVEQLCTCTCTLYMFCMGYLNSTLYTRQATCTIYMYLQYLYIMKTWL